MTFHQRSERSTTDVQTRRWGARAGLLMTALLMFGLFGALGSVNSMSAQAAPAWAYVWADDFTAESYTPNESYQYNSTGELNTITRTDVGVYSVFLPGMVKEAQTQVSTLSENGELCRIASQAGGKVLEVVINCIAIGGDPVDIGFFVLNYRGTAGATSAYLWANDSAAETYTPDERYQFNSGGELNTIARTDAGTYTVTLPGQGAESGNFQISATNSGPGVACAIRRWEITGENAKLVEVNCFDSTGARVDSNFSLAYVDANDANLATQTTGAFLQADHASAKELYTPGQNYQFSTAGVPGTSQWREIGAYTVTLPDVGQELGNFQVTAFEYPVAACSIPRWVLNGTNYEIDVICFNADGELADSIFTLSYMVAQ